MMMHEAVKMFELERMIVNRLAFGRLIRRSARLDTHDFVGRHVGGQRLNLSERPFSGLVLGRNAKRMR